MIKFKLLSQAKLNKKPPLSYDVEKLKQNLQEFKRIISSTPFNFNQTHAFKDFFNPTKTKVENENYTFPTTLLTLAIKFSTKNEAPFSPFNFKHIIDTKGLNFVMTDLTKNKITTSFNIEEPESINNFITKWSDILLDLKIISYVDKEGLSVLIRDKNFLDALNLFTAKLQDFILLSKFSDVTSVDDDFIIIDSSEVNPTTTIEHFSINDTYVKS